MAIKVIVQQAGPMPIKATFQPLGNLPTYIEVNGSVWSKSANVLIGVGVDLDGQNVGQAKIFSNGTSTHRAVVPAYIPVKLGDGTHTLTLSAATAQTLSDLNDFYTVVIHY